MIQRGLGEVEKRCKGAYKYIEDGLVMGMAAAEKRIELNFEQIVQTGALKQME